MTSSSKHQSVLTCPDIFNMQQQCNSNKTLFQFSSSFSPKNAQQFDSPALNKIVSNIDTPKLGNLQLIDLNLQHQNSNDSYQHSIFDNNSQLGRTDSLINLQDHQTSKGVLKKSKFFEYENNVCNDNITDIKSIKQNEQIQNKKPNIPNKILKICILTVLILNIGLQIHLYLGYKQQDKNVHNEIEVIKKIIFRNLQEITLEIEKNLMISIELKCDNFNFQVFGTNLIQNCMLNNQQIQACSCQSQNGCAYGAIKSNSCFCELDLCHPHPINIKFNLVCCSIF